ncbi:hypothetical protein ACH4NF_31945 [Streptomyces sp. NPDC017248]|uniref:hypothetical protein n=1 Tax=unclassified Streptomyces TaxID=2593676 RepID=UPI0037A57F03
MRDTLLPHAPMSPDAVISAFSYLRAVQADDMGAGRELAYAGPRMAAWAAACGV